MKTWIERKTGLLFGTFQAKGADFRFVSRIGYGPQRQLCILEFGINGRSFYVDRMPKR